MKNIPVSLNIQLNKFILKCSKLQMLDDTLTSLVELNWGYVCLPLSTEYSINLLLKFFRHWCIGVYTGGANRVKTKKKLLKSTDVYSHVRVFHPNYFLVLNWCPSESGGSFMVALNPHIIFTVLTSLKKNLFLFLALEVFELAKFEYNSWEVLELVIAKLQFFWGYPVWKNLPWWWPGGIES